MFLTMIYGRQVDGFGPDRAQPGRHLQPQLVAVHPQWPDGASFVLGSDLQAHRPHLPHIFTRSLPLFHHITGQVSPPGMKKINTNLIILSFISLFSPLYATLWVKILQFIRHRNSWGNSCWLKLSSSRFSSVAQQASQLVGVTNIT